MIELSRERLLPRDAADSITWIGRSFDNTRAQAPIGFAHAVGCRPRPLDPSFSGLAKIVRKPPNGASVAGISGEDL